MQLFNVMLRGKGESGYAAAGRLELAAKPRRGEEIAVEREGRVVRGTIDELYIPPGCDEHCMGTIFASAS